MHCEKFILVNPWHPQLLTFLLLSEHGTCVLEPQQAVAVQAVQAGQEQALGVLVSAGLPGWEGCNSQRGLVTFLVSAGSNSLGCPTVAELQLSFLLTARGAEPLLQLWLTEWNYCTQIIQQITLAEPSAFTCSDPSCILIWTGLKLKASGNILGGI